MLVLARRKFEKVVIGDIVKVTFLGMKGDKARLGFEAPDHMGICREEIWPGADTTQEEAEALWSPS